MRTWILVAGIMVAKAIRPIFAFELIIFILIAGLGVVGVIMDMIEFEKKVS